jgi:taurine dioxygenase
MIHYSPLRIHYSLTLLFNQWRIRRMSQLQIMPTSGALGAEVCGVDLRHALDTATVVQLQTAFHDHCLLLFRRQQLTKADQVRFSAYFGEPVPHPTNTRDRDPEFPEITIISNIEENGKAVGALGNDEIHFHADLVFLPTPGSVSLLYCVETPAQGGDTLWSNGYAGYAALDVAQQERVAGLKAVYVHSNPAYNPPTPPEHPLVCTHPETGRKTLFFSPNAAKTIVGMSAEESQHLLDELYTHATQERFLWRHHWQPGDLILWDNRCTMHRREAFDNRERRLMYRTQLLGAPSR